MVKTDKPVYGAAHAGCWFDGARGIYIGDCVIREAIAHGWQCDVPPCADPKPWAPTPTWEEHEHYHELWDEAEEYMQQFADEHHYFGTSDWGGDWGLWECEQEE